MAANENEGTNYYAVLGLKKDCSDGEVRTAYKKLALRWHPDRCTASGDSKNIEEAKKKFQAIQEAYSVLSDKSKRTLYDFGVYDSNVDEGFTEFMNEMADLMKQNLEKQSSENAVESYEDLKTLFEDMFHDDLERMNYPFQSGATSSSSFSTFGTYAEKPESSNKRSYGTNLRKYEVDKSSCFDTQFQGFNFGVGADEQQSLREGGCAPGEYKSRRTGRKQKVSANHDVSSNNNAGIC